jgi:hypothetical protein
MSGMIIRTRWALGLTPESRARIIHEAALRRFGRILGAIARDYQDHMEEAHGRFFLL